MKRLKFKSQDLDMEDSNLVDMEEEEELDEWLRNALFLLFALS